MFSKLFTFLLNVFLITNQLISYVKSDDNISVRIKNGLIYGKKDVSVDGLPLNVFLGIPYAQPPLGPLRFKKPLPVVDEWGDAHPLNATQWPKACFHPKFHANYLNDDMSEDCLYLNIWSPVAERENTPVLKPVMFFIHGGGYLLGSSVEDQYSGHVLSAKGDVVVVTINYRINTLGLLYTGAEGTAPGNAMLWDQALALEWVNDNIGYFGGDKESITVFGESAGAFSASLFVLSPVTRHMFRNAIPMSGAVVNDKHICEPEVVLKMSIELSIRLGCGDGENTESFTPKMIECLLNSKPEQLVTPKLWQLDGCLLWIIRDGQFIIDRPSTQHSNRDYKTNVNLMVGTVEDEVSFTMALSFDPKKYDKHSPTVMGYDEARDELTILISSIIPSAGNDAKHISEHYFQGMSVNTCPNLLRRTIGIALGDYILSCGTMLFARRVFNNSADTNVYQYYYTHKSKTDSFLCSPWMGACHADDIFPVFGYAFTHEDRYDDTDRHISAQMIQIFSSFAKTGKPSLIDRSIDWRKYYRIDDNIIAPYYQVSGGEHNDRNNFGVNLKSIECEFLWKKYIDY